MLQPIEPVALRRFVVAETALDDASVQQCLWVGKIAPLAHFLATREPQLSFAVSALLFVAEAGVRQTSLALI